MDVLLLMGGCHVVVRVCQPCGSLQANHTSGKNKFHYHDILSAYVPMR